MKALLEAGPLATNSIFIVGNAPSLLRHDLERLRDIPTFASNRIFLIFNRTSWRPSFYSCIDTAVLPDIALEICHWARKLRDTKFILPDHIFTHQNPRVPTRVCTLIRPRRNVYFYKSIRLELEGAIDRAFRCDGVTNEVVEAMTVTIGLMQMAVKLGARRIYLIGCDTDYRIPADARVLDQESRRVDKRIILESDEDPNHFDPAYFGKGRVWHTPNVPLMIKHYKVAKSVCDAVGVKVFNAGIGGKLDVFPRVSYDEAIEQCLLHQ